MSDQNDVEKEGLNDKVGGITSAISGFFSEVGAEFRRITWPKGKELTESTVVVLSFIVILSLTVLVFDKIIEKVLGLIVGA